MINSEYSCEIVIKKPHYNTYEAICGFGWDSKGGSGLYIMNNTLNRDYNRLPTSGFKIYNTDKCSITLTQNNQFLNGVEKIKETEDTSWNSGQGYINVGGYGTAQKYGFVGEIDAVRYYNRSLTPDEIAANYAIDKERFGLP